MREHEAVARGSKVYPILALIVALYVALAAAEARTERPQIDEGFFAGPALNLLRKGFMGTTTIETAGTNVESIHRHTYWVMPLDLVLQAGWYKLFGFSLFKMRALSILWGVAALVSWFLIMRALGGDARLALAACALIASDYLFLTISASGRMDMMSAALGFASYAAYLSLRERRLVWAVLVSQTLTVASGLTHPVGGTLAFCGLLFLTLYFDRRRLNWYHLAVALMPYVAGALGWGLYIAREPSAFLPQFTNNARMNNRMGGFSNPLRAIADEFTVRYPTVFGLGGHSAGHSGAIYLKALVLVAYVGAIAGTLVVARLRRHSGFRALLCLTAIYFLVPAILDGQKMSYNLVYIMPLYAALLAVFLGWCWRQGRAARALVAACFAGVVLLQAGGVLFRVRQNTYATGYVPAINYLRQHAGPSDLIIGSSAMGFGLDFPETLDDDVKFGYYSGKHPAYIVIDPEYQATLDTTGDRQPEIREHLARLLAEDYRLVHEEGAYAIYQRR